MEWKKPNYRENGQLDLVSSPKVLVQVKTKRNYNLRKYEQPYWAMLRVIPMSNI